LNVGSIRELKVLKNERQYRLLIQEWLLN
jgi:hypothetical protein